MVKLNANDFQSYVLRYGGIVIKAHIRKIIPFSSVDGVGNRTGIFLQGCNLDCRYCHNPETIHIFKRMETIENGKIMSVDEIVDEVMQYKDFTSGVTLSGGECTIHFEFLSALILALKARDIHVLIDTNGLVNDRDMQALIRIADGFMLDIKSIDELEHIQLTGKSNLQILSNAHAIAKEGKLVEVRTVIVPDVLDNENNVNQTSRLIVKYDQAIRYKLIKYRQIGVRENRMLSESPTDGYMKTLKEIAENNGCSNILVV